MVIEENTRQALNGSLFGPLMATDNKTEQRMVILQWLVMPFVLAGSVFPAPNVGEPPQYVLYAAIFMIVHPLVYFIITRTGETPVRLRNFYLTATDVTVATFVFYSTVSRPGYAQVLLFCTVALAASRYERNRSFGITTLIAFLLFTAALLPLHVSLPTVASEILALYALTYLIGLWSQAEKAIMRAATENAALAQTVLRRNGELHALNRLLRVLSAQTTGDDVLQQGATGIADALDVQNIRIYKIDNDKPAVLMQRVQIDRHDGETESSWRADAARALATKITIIDGQPVQLSARQGIPSLLTIPLIVHGRVTAIVQAYFADELQESVSVTIDTLDLFCSELGVAMENAFLRVESSRSAILQEKNRIAQELHDTVLQILFGTGLRLQWSLDQLSIDSPVYGAVAEAKSLSVKAGEELRSAIFTLSSDIAEVGLVSAVKRLVADQAQKASWSCNVNISGDVPTLPVLVQNVAHRVVRESLMNAYKHASATEVIVSLRFTDAALTITIQDNGIGIPHDVVDDFRTQRDHFGLRSVAEQLEAVGGLFTMVRDTEESGTLVKATIPFARWEQVA